MARLGSIVIHVEKESYRDQVKATEYAVERGEPYTDHIEAQPFEFSLSAYLIGDDYETRLEKLKEYMKKGAVLKYTGRSSASNVVILDIARDYTADIGNGVAVSISLRRIRIASSPWVKAPPKRKPVQKPTTQSGKKKPVSKKARTTSARYHITRAGDTYYGLSRKYGSSIQQLRTWNRYPDRQIPIGIKLRVK